MTLGKLVPYHVVRLVIDVWASYREKQYSHVVPIPFLETTCAYGSAVNICSPALIGRAARKPLPFPSLQKRSSLRAMFQPGPETANRVDMYGHNAHAYAVL